MPASAIEPILAAPHAVRPSFARTLVGLDSALIRRFVSSLLPEHRFAAFATLILDAPTNIWNPSFITPNFSVVGIEKVKSSDLSQALECVVHCISKRDKGESEAENRYLTGAECKAVYGRVLDSILAQTDIAKHAGALSCDICLCDCVLVLCT